MKTLSTVISMLILTSATMAQTDTVITSTTEAPEPIKEKVKVVVEKVKEVKKEQCEKFNKEDDKPIKTLMGGKKSKGAYVGFSFNHSFVNGESAIGSGMRLGFISNHTLAIGFYGSGFASTPYLESTLLEESLDINAGHGGIFIEPVLFPRLPVHVSFPINFGVGGMALTKSYKYDDYRYDYYLSETGVFTIVEPGIELEANLFKHMRIAFDMTYRKTYALRMHSVDHDVLDGLSYGFTVKLGKF